MLKEKEKEFSKSSGKSQSYNIVRKKQELFEKKDISGKSNAVITHKEDKFLDADSNDSPKKEAYDEDNKKNINYEKDNFREYSITGIHEKINEIKADIDINAHRIKDISSDFNKSSDEDNESIKAHNNIRYYERMESNNLLENYHDVELRNIGNINYHHENTKCRKGDDYNEEIKYRRSDKND